MAKNEKNESEHQSKLIALTGLWAHKTKDGKGVILAGNLGGARVLVMRNQWKKKDTDPDYRLLITEQQEKPDDKAADPIGEEVKGDKLPF